MFRHPRLGVLHCVQNSASFAKQNVAEARSEYFKPNKTNQKLQMQRTANQYNAIY